MYHSFGTKKFKVTDKLLPLYCSICDKKLKKGKYAVSFYCQHGMMYSAFYICFDCYKHENCVKRILQETDLHQALAELYEYRMKGYWFTNGQLEADFVRKCYVKK